MDSYAMLFGIILCFFVSAQCERVKRQFYQDYHGYGQPVLVYKTRPLRLKEKEEQQDLSKIPGVPGVDYPVYHEVPHTNFDCRHVPAVPGMYANVETGCQAYHVCNDGRDGHQGSSFLCTNGTIFNQKEFACDWWYNVDCNEALDHYRLNLDPLKNPYTKKEAEEQLKKQQEYHQYY